MEKRFEKPQVSIITVNTNGLQDTIACIESIYANTDIDFELIVVENNSNDGSLEYLSALTKRYNNFVIVPQNEKRTFAESNNNGLQYAEGEYICFLNNDTVVSKGWLTKMKRHFTETLIKNVGMVGPVSSNSNGRQMVGNQNPNEWYQKNKGRWSTTGCLYGWCMLAPKKLIDEIGGFDPRFTNSYEDNDLSLRFRLAGHELIIAYDTYIYHKGQSTLQKMYKRDDYYKNGLVNREAYFNKYYDTKPKKLVAVYRIANCEKYIRESLERASEFADHIIVNLCRSHDNTEKIVREFPKVCKVNVYNGPLKEHEERDWLLQEALKLQQQGEADWCISIDGDEVYEKAFVDRVHKMMNPRNPEVLGYWCQWRTIWDRQLGKEYYRTDSTFGQFSNYRFFRLIPGQKIDSEHPEGFHCGSAPVMPPENIRWSKIRVKHLGYDTPEQRQEKFEWYQKNDHFQSKKDIGNDGYGHLITRDVKTNEWRENNGISLVMMIKNEQHDILDCLEQIEHVVDEMIIVDTGSTDKTIELVEQFKKYSQVPVKLLNYAWEDNFSTPRNYGKRHATKEWVLMLDADERFKYHDLNILFNITETDANVVQFHVINYLEPFIPGQGKKPKYASTQAIRLFRNIPELYWSGIIHETLDDSMALLKRKGDFKPVSAPTKLHHYGYLKPKNKVQDKLDLYEKLNKQQIEVTGGLDPRPYFNLALHYLNDDAEVDAVEMLEKSIKIDDKFWHGYQQLASLGLSSGKKWLEKVLRTLPKEHPYYKEAMEIYQFLSSKSIGYQKVGERAG